MLRSCGTATFAPLKHWCQQGKPEQRLHALRLLWILAREAGDESHITYASNTVKADRASSVQALPDEWQSMLDTNENDNYEYQVPIPEWHGDDTPQLRALINTALDEANQGIEQQNRQMRHWHEQSGGKHQLYQRPLPAQFSALHVSRATLDNPP